MSRGSGLSGLCAMAKVALLPAGAPQSCDRMQHPAQSGDHARAPAARHSEGAAARDARACRDRFRRRSVEPRSALHPRAAARRDARARPRGARCAPLRACWRGGCGARRPRSRWRSAVAAAALSQAPWSDRGPIGFDAEKFIRLPAEVALRLLGRAIAHAGDEGPVQLGKLEALYAALGNADAGDRSETFRLRRTLAGALVTLTERRLVVERAPARRSGRRTLHLNHGQISLARHPPNGGSIGK